MDCICSQSQKKISTCFNQACLATWEEEKMRHERTACPVHKFILPVGCGYSTPPLCLKCQHDGYYVERVGKTWFPTMELRKN